MKMQPASTSDRSTVVVHATYHLAAYATFFLTLCLGAIALGRADAGVVAMTVLFAPGALIVLLLELRHFLTSCGVALRIDEHCIRQYNWRGEISIPWRSVVSIESIGSSDRVLTIKARNECGDDVAMLVTDDSIRQPYQRLLDLIARHRPDLRVQ